MMKAIIVLNGVNRLDRCHQLEGEGLDLLLIDEASRGFDGVAAACGKYSRGAIRSIRST